MIEDGTFAGEGLTILQTLTYFVAAPTILFVVISFFAYITAKETRSKKKSKPVSLTSIDHVIPRSRGGGHNWENVVSACHKCNHLKADKTLKDLGWRLRHTPREPVGAAWRILGTGKPHRIWIPYLKPFGVEAIGAASA